MLFASLGHLFSKLVPMSSKEAKNATDLRRNFGRQVSSQMNKINFFIELIFCYSVLLFFFTFSTNLSKSDFKALSCAGLNFSYSFSARAFATEALILPVLVSIS